MNFIAPFMLWGAAAASIPIAIHFFFRSRYRTVPWAAMKFLLTSIEQTSRRVKFQELLLLLLRCAVLILLALALARPLSTALGGGSSGRGEAVDTVMVFDTSYSMGARDGNEIRFERVRKAALDIIDKLPAHSTVQVITCADRADLLGPRNPVNLDQARDLVSNLQLTSLASDFLPGMQEASAVLKRGQLPNKELYFFSDMQGLGWEHQAESLNNTLREIGQQAGVFLVRCGTGKVSNAAIVEITPQAGFPRPGERLDFAVLVRNTGSEPIKDLQVALSIDGKAEERDAQAIKELPGGATRAVLLTGKMGQPGLHVVTAILKQDDLEADNRLDQVILVRDQVQVLVVDGAPNQQEPEKAASFFITNALRPVREGEAAKYYLQPEVVRARQALPAMLAGKSICVLANVALEPDRRRPNLDVLSAEFLDELKTFVRAGGGLMIFAGENVNPAAYNKQLGEMRHLMPFSLKGVIEHPRTEPVLLARETVALPGFRRLRDDELFKSINAVLTWIHLDIDPASLPAAVQKKLADTAKELKAEADREKETGKTPDKAAKRDLTSVRSSTEVVLTYTDGKPALLASRIDGGEVLFFTTAGNPGVHPTLGGYHWTSLGRFPRISGVPLMQMAVNHLLTTQTQSHNTVAGTTLAYHVPEKEASRSFVLLAPDGGKRRLGLPEAAQGRFLLNIDQMPLAGIYRLISTDSAGGGVDILDEAEKAELKRGRSRVGKPLAVAPDLRDSADLQALSTEQIDQRLGFRVTHVVAGTDPASLSQVDRTNREWTYWLLIAVLVLAVGETLLAWFCGRAW